MPFHQPDAVRFYTFESFDAAGVCNASFCRQGGSSPQPWASLNVGGTVGDDPERVLHNRVLSFRTLSRPFESLFDVWQVHSAEVVCASAPRQPGVPHLKADAILTDQPGVTLFMRFADCVPIFLYDPLHRAVGLVHAGWQGTVSKIAAHAVRAMRTAYRTQPQDLLAAIGPSIGPDHYIVGQDVVQKVRQAFLEGADGFLRSSNAADGNSGVQFDLWSANQHILAEAGVRQIEVSGICTACHLEDWYSHRAEKGRTGRFGALIAL